MFQPTTRYILRCSLIAVAAIISSLVASTVGSGLTLNEVFVALGSGFTAGMSYAGIGAASKNVEPHVGNKAN